MKLFRVSIVVRNGKSLKIYKFYIYVILVFLLFGCKSHSLLSAEELENYNTELAGMNIDKLNEARYYAGGSGCVIRGDKEVFCWGDVNQIYDLKSTTKSIGVTALGLAIKDGKMNLSDKAQQYYPTFGIPPNNNKNTGWLGDITLLHLATHTAGFEKNGGYTDLLFKPGEAWVYSDGGPNWLADCITLAYDQDLKTLMFDRVFGPIGIKSSDLKWRDNWYREDTINGIKRREFGSGISANVKAMVRIGRLFLRKGEWEGQEIIPKSFIDLVRSQVGKFTDLPVVNDKNSIFQNASKHYGLLWWNNANGALRSVPKDAYWSWGLHDSTIVVIPSLDIVIARGGSEWSGERKPNFYKVMEPFLEPIVASVNHGSPYPNSPVISNIIWGDSSDIIRKASGSDNWPLTWADDDNLYTAYGDGYGFVPKAAEKLSMGFAKIEGNFPDFTGINIRSSSEQYGDGSSGKKASGMLSVGGILYMWVRNVDGKGKQSQLAWSDDHGETWQWSNWKLEEFGYCTFVNFGKNYDDAMDNFVYIVSHDNPNAYERADRFILMRVPKDQIKNRGSYEFLEKIDTNGNPIWTSNIIQRGAVFRHPGQCYRSGISYNVVLKRYLWWQAKFPKGHDGKKAGMFGIFDAPEPWGPWSTVYYTKNWDVGAGETGSFPTKWMSQDGRSMHLVFSGNDAFSVRKVTLLLSTHTDAK